MSIIYVLIPIAIILVLIAIGVFFWAVKSDQFEDLERQGYSILFDDDLDKQGQHQDPSSEEGSSLALESTPHSRATKTDDKRR